MIYEFISFFCSHFDQLIVKSLEQLNLVIFSTAGALVIGLLLSLIAMSSPLLKRSLMTLSAIIWTIPSLALLAFLIPIMGIGFKPAFCVLMLFGILPIFRGTISAFEAINPRIFESAEALGLNRKQILSQIVLPLILPGIFHGVRTSTVICVGIATLAAFIGAGGLGDFINQGISSNNGKLIMLGAVPSALMALGLDLFLHKIEVWLFERRKAISYRKAKLLVALILLLFPSLTLIPDLFTTHDGKHMIVVGSKDSTEQFILAEMMAEVIEKKTDLNVVRKFNLGSESILHSAMIRGDVDIYPEYTGSAWFSILNRPYQGESSQVMLEELKSEYSSQYAIEWLCPFGFNNSASIVVKKYLSDQLGMTTLSQLVPFHKKLTVATETETAMRDDGLPGLKGAYGLEFSKIKILSAAMLYLALENDEADIVTGFTTDGPLTSEEFITLIDDRSFFPPYDAVPLVTQKVIKEHPQVVQALNTLSGQLTSQRMRKLNYQVEVEHRSVSDVVHEFLKENVFSQNGS